MTQNIFHGLAAIKRHLREKSEFVAPAVIGVLCVLNCLLIAVVYFFGW